MREAFFSAVRSVIEAMAPRSPLVLAFEDIHWADDGMLDLIEYLGAVGARRRCCSSAWPATSCSSAARAGAAAGASATSIFLDPLTPSETRELVAALLPGDAAQAASSSPAVAERAGGNPFFAEEMVRRLAEEERRRGRAARHRAGAAGRAARLARAASSAGSCSTPRSSGARSGRASLAAGGRRRGRATSTRALRRCSEKDIVVPGRGRRLAGEPRARVQARADPRRRLRDAAQGGARAQALRGRRLHRGARRRPHRRGRRAARRALRARRGAGRRGAASTPPSSQPIHAKALALPRGRGRRRRRASTPTARPFAPLPVGARAAPRTTPARRARIGEKQGDVALRLGRVDAAIEVWEECLEYHRARRGPRARRRPAPQDRRRPLAQGRAQAGDRAPPEGHQPAQGRRRRRLELVRLYEEAAWLYMQTGDNMLAIYASEKALRLAERLGETRAASRAHGIFGRVFGRIGDTAKARENLERVGRAGARLRRRARRSSRCWRSATTSRSPRPTTPAPRRAYARGARPGRARSATCRRRSSCTPALAQLAVYRADWDGVQALHRRRAPSSPSARAWSASSACPYALRGLLRWRDGDWDEAERLYRRAHELAEQVGWSEVAVLGAVRPRRRRCATAATTPAAVTALDQALDVCERAGPDRAVDPGHVGAGGRARRWPARTTRRARRPRRRPTLAERLHYPVGEAAALEAERRHRRAREGVPSCARRRAWPSLGRAARRRALRAAGRARAARCACRGGARARRRRVRVTRRSTASCAGRARGGCALSPASPGSR